METPEFFKQMINLNSWLTKKVKISVPTTKLGIEKPRVNRKSDSWVGEEERGRPSTREKAKPEPQKWKALNMSRHARGAWERETEDFLSHSKLNSTLLQ